MKLRIEHRTNYNYSEKVVPGMHYLHFYPQGRPYLKTTDFTLQVAPEPALQSARVDPENNMYHQVWMKAAVESMDIRVVIELETFPFNPFEFIVDTNGPQSSDEYLASNERYFVPFLTDSPLSDEMHEFAVRHRTEDPVSSFRDIAHTISQEWEHETRTEQGIFSPRECFDRKAGSCRDLTRMAIAMLRNQGYPCRYVGGYCFVPELGDGHELHAWLEVYLPGSGWLGVDPSLGLLASGNHIPVASSFDPTRTMPVQGFYHGNATSELNTTVSISPID